MLTKHVTVTALLAAAVLLENSVLFNYLQREHCTLSVPAKSSGLQAVLRKSFRAVSSLSKAITTTTNKTEKKKKKRFGN